MHVLTLKTNLRMPFMREYLLLHGLSDVSRQTCIKILNRYSLASFACCKPLQLPQSEQQLTTRISVHE